MKYWRGFLVAAIFAAITWALQLFADSHRALIDMIYPYITRLIQTFLSGWCAGVDFCLWQVIAMLLVVLLLASIVVMIVLRWNFFQWMGWVLASASLLVCLHTGIYGLNSYAGPLSDDIRLTETDYTVTELTEATRYYLEEANKLAAHIQRDEQGDPVYPDFDAMAAAAGDGFEALTMEKSLSVFAGSRVPVKKLGWADMYTSMGITGFTMPLTGEAAVNPNIPAISIPFTMCHEMAHRMCIAYESDANLAAYLACINNSDIHFRYSGYFMAFQYCYIALSNVGTSTANAAAQQIRNEIGDLFRHDYNSYITFFAREQDQAATNLANKVNDAYIKGSGDDRGVESYGDVCDLLVSWYIQEIYLPAHKEEIPQFDPLDKNQVDLSGLPNAGGN